MKKIKIVSILITLCLLMTWIIPCMQNEVLTWQHGTEFTGLQKSTGMIDEVDYLKVLDYSENFAKVYYVSNDGGGDMLIFVKDNGNWKLETWETIWSTSGSADDFIWPYFYHSSEGIIFFILIVSTIFILSSFMYVVYNKLSNKSISNI
jgi:hypothetical protein